MSSFTPRLYERHNLVLEKIKSDCYCVKIFTLPVNANPDVLSNKHLEKYKTPAYNTETEAFTHAYGWIDFTLFNQTDLDEKEDSWKKAYKKLRNDQEDFYNFLWESEKKLTPSMEKQKQEHEIKLEKAYREGWDKKLIDGDIGN